MNVEHCLRDGVKYKKNNIFYEYLTIITVFLPFNGQLKLFVGPIVENNHRSCFLPVFGEVLINGHCRLQF